MSSNTGELRHVMLGSIFKPEVPLGSARGTPITCHASATGKGKGKLHGSPECRALRSAASVNQFDIPFGEAVERLCTNCRWALFTDSPILPLGAAVNDVDSLTIWLDRGPEDEDDIKAERDAAVALATGDYRPHTNDVGDADEDANEAGHDENWERYDRARDLRYGRLSHWRRLHSYLIRSNQAVADYPFSPRGPTDCRVGSPPSSTPSVGLSRTSSSLPICWRLLPYASCPRRNSPAIPASPDWDRRRRRPFGEPDASGVAEPPGPGSAWKIMTSRCRPSSATPSGAAARGSPKLTPPSVSSPPTGSARREKKPPAPPPRRGSWWQSKHPLSHAPATTSRNATLSPSGGHQSSPPTR